MIVEKAKSVLQQILETLVKEPEKINIEHSYSSEGDIHSLSISVSQADMGLIIGRSGRTAQSIRSIMHIVGKSLGLVLRIEFLETDGRVMYRDTYPFVEKQDYNYGNNQRNYQPGKFSRQYGQRFQNDGNNNIQTQDHYTQRRASSKPTDGYDPLQIDLN
jgi:hypothetical protein